MKIVEKVYKYIYHINRVKVIKCFINEEFDERGF